jgi:hypothetical protein
MITLENAAVALLFLTFAVCCFRARWVALSLAPPVLLILARLSGLVDISSASHPLRFVVPLLSLSLAMWAGWVYAKILRSYDAHGELMKSLCGEAALQQAHSGAGRALTAALLVFASDCTDIPALFMWQIPGVWVLVPLQIVVCLAVIYVLVMPERWLIKCLR